jgi:MarR family transcriptional regulator, lower aerobic nicotinate degradation pathway regulator
MLRAAHRRGARDAAPGTDTPEAVRAVVDALRHIVRELRLSAREAERGAGISGAQLFVLQALAHASAASLNELAERTLTDQSSVSVVVKRLVARNLVTRRPSRADARRVELGLTAGGRRLLARCPEPTQVKLVSALRRLSARELQDLTVGLGGLVREMGLGKTAPGMFFDDESPSRAVTRPAPRRARTPR